MNKYPECLIRRFPPINLFSNKQIKSLDNKHYELMLRFIKQRTGKDVKIDKCKSDVEIYKDIREQINPKSHLINNIYSTRDIHAEIMRGKSRVNELLRVIPINNHKYKSMLDIGCGNGIISKCLASRLHIDKLHMIEPYVDEVHTYLDNNISECKFIKEPITKANLHDKYDLICFITSIHHIWDADIVLDIAKKHLSNTGVIVFREHRPECEQDKMCSDIFDKLWHFCFTTEAEPTLDNYMNDIPCGYFYKVELDELMKDMKIYHDDIKCVNYDINQWMCYFSYVY